MHRKLNIAKRVSNKIEKYPTGSKEYLSQLTATKYNIVDNTLLIYMGMG